MSDYIETANAAISASILVGGSLAAAYWQLRVKWAQEKKKADEDLRQTLLDNTSDKVKDAIRPVAETTAPHLLEVIITFATRLGALEEKIHELEEVTVAQRREIERLQSELEHKVAELDRLDQQYQEALKDKAALLRDVEALRKEIATLQSEIALLQAEIAKLRG